MSKKSTAKRTLKVFIILALLLATASVAFGQGEVPGTMRGDRADYDRALPGEIAGAKLDAPITVDSSLLLGGLHSSLADATGTQRVVVRLTSPAVAAAAADGADSAGMALAAEAAAMQQSTVVANAMALDPNAEVVATMQLALNAVIMRIDASALSALANNPDVESVNPVVDYQLDLTETVPYIGGTAVQNMGYDGSGIKVAVLDSGVDYTHANLGGSGDPNDWLNNDPNIIEPGTFPTAKVVGGYDFVGPTWPDTPEIPDPDPLDLEGHGTHVADIIGGVNGVAPGADIYAVQVCSSISSSCSGIALLQAYEFILDPNGDGDISDAMDIVNMSLGANYGNAYFDDLSQAVENATALGVLTVSSAGNGSDKPYIQGTPASAPSAISVAQTNVPSAVLPQMEVTAPEGITGLYVAAFQPWSVPLSETGVVEGPLQYGDIGGGNENGCSPYTGDLTGLVVLADRGACNFTLKIKNIGDAGGVAGIIGLVAPGAPFGGGDGGDRPITIPGFMISQADSDALKSGLPDTFVRFDPANGIPLVQNMVGSSSRGPSMGSNDFGVDIGAPGASVSAVAGSGTGEGPFGGTSGASPMVAGSAALLMDAYPERSWAEIKAVLINTAETDIMNEPMELGGELAPISRIGGGEVRVDRALASPLAAWDKNALDGGLSFGFLDVSSNSETLVKRVFIQNYSAQDITLRSDVSFRFDEDEGGEVRLSVPSWFTVPSRGNVSFPIYLHISQTGDRSLPPWVMNSGGNGANPDALTANEYDGYITFTDTSNPENTVHMPWHVLPRGASEVEYGVQQTGFSWIRNAGRSEVFVDTFSLLGTSPDLPEGAPGSQEQRPDFRAVGVQTYPVPAGFCGPNESFIMGFAVNTWERQTTALPTYFSFLLDMDEDGVDDYEVFNFDLSLSTAVSDGRNVTWVADLATGDATAFFFTVHATNSANTVLLFCGDQIGLDASAFLTESFDVDAFAVDWYYGGPGDEILDMNVVPLGERYFTVFENGDVGSTTLPARSGKLGFGVIDFGDQFNTTETGLLWLYDYAAEGEEAKIWDFSQ